MFSISGFAQQGSFLKHTVVDGESLVEIAQKYKVTLADIYKLNPDSKKKVQSNLVLIIPIGSDYIKSRTLTPESAPRKLLASNEKTIRDVADKYYGKGAGGTYGSGTGAAPVAMSKMTTTVVKNAKVLAVKVDKPLYHVVLPSETKYAIAKKYGISVVQLEKQNPAIVTNLAIGSKILISGKIQTPVLVKEVAKPLPVKTELVKKAKVAAFVIYEVKSKETLYSLTKKFGLSKEQLIAENPELVNGVKEAMFLKIPSVPVATMVNATSVVAKTITNANFGRRVVNLSKSLKKQERKQLVLMLPFNIAKLESDTINTAVSKLKTDKFLNMTLDFYAGALVAIDSAKALGLNVNVRILDSQETKTSSNVANLISHYNLQKANAVVGPFYQANVEKTAELLNKYNVPVISPLSKEAGKAVSNLYHSMPTNDVLKSTTFDFMHAKGGNIVAVIDAKRTAIKQYITDNQKGVKFVGLNAKGVFALDSLRKTLVKNKLNYVILDSQKTGTIMSVTASMVKLMAEYQLQLVVLEPNPTLDFEEIPLNRLTKLKMLYPSLIRENETHEAHVFENEYRRKNKIAPSQYATRGFDVTFDTLLRLSQDKSFEATVQTTATEQVENKFNYSKNTTEGYTNKGVYILYYDNDLTVKEAR
jgi:LysM repeat protein